MTNYVLELSCILDRRMLRALVKQRRFRRETCVDVANNDNVRVTTVVLFELYKLNSQHLIISLLQRSKTLLQV